MKSWPFFVAVFVSAKFARSRLREREVSARVDRRPDLAARKLVEIANGVETVQDDRLYIERVNAPFLAAGGSGDDFRAGVARDIALGWLWRHESARFVKFTDDGAALFA